MGRPPDIEHFATIASAASKLIGPRRHPVLQPEDGGGTEGYDLTVNEPATQLSSDQRLGVGADLRERVVDLYGLLVGFLVEKALVVAWAAINTAAGMKVKHLDQPADWLWAREVIA